MSTTMSPVDKDMDMDKFMQVLVSRHFQHYRQLSAEVPPANFQHHQPSSTQLPLEKKVVGSPVHNRQRPASCQSPFEFMTSSPNSSPTKFSPPSMSAEQAHQAAANMAAQRKQLERSFSEQTDNRPSKSSNINPSRYKTEMCRPFEESGHCKYGDKCQFAHGAYELRNLARHPKYKTDLCRTFHTIGFCPYGPRCHFIHNEDEHKLNYIIQQKQQQAVQQAVVQQAAQVQQLQQQHQLLQPTPIQRPKLYLPEGYGRNILGSTADSPPLTPPDSITSDSPQSLSPTSGLGDNDVFSLGMGSSTPPYARPHEFSSSLNNMSIHIPKPTIMSPLNVETALNIEAEQLALLLASLPVATSTASTPSSLPDSTGSSLNSSFHTTTSLNTPPTPPESLSGDEELQRSLRLPFFSQLEQQQQRQ